MGLTRAARPRTLGEALRTLSAEDLAELLRRRPDLADPAPDDLSELAARAGNPSSVARALDRTDAWLRLVAEGLAALPDPTGVRDLAALLDEPVEVVARAVQTLRRRALLWGPDDQLHLVRAVREAFEPYPGGLAPPSPRPLTTEQITAALAECPPEVQPVLDRLLFAPAGAVRFADRPVNRDTARTPVEQLLARGLLRPLDADTVLLPREVAWQLRGGRFAAEPVAAEPPPVTGTRRDPRLVDRAGVGAAAALLHDVELVALTLERAPHRLLRTGGLAARDLAALARALGTDAASAAIVLECAAAAGLLAPGSTLTLVPTADYDDWLSNHAAERWRVLAEAWLDAERLFLRSAAPGGHVLGPEADVAAAPDLRRLVLELAAHAEPGTVVDQASLAAAVTYQRPRLARRSGADGASPGQPPLDAPLLVDWTWREASLLGLVSLGAVTAFGTALLRGEPVPAALAEQFPAPVDRLVLQADLTAVAPGPLEPAVAAELQLLADQESRGAGGVYRFSAGSVRRAFAAGRTADQVTGWLQQHAATEVPQPLAYLVADVARRYGSIRVGSASCYIRTEDEAQAAALLQHPQAAGLGLRALAPGVLVATADEQDVVALLQEVGHSPVLEDAAGRTVPAPPRPRAARRRAARAPAPDPAELAAGLLVTDGRSGSRPALAETVQRLRDATEEAVPVTVTYVTPDGSAVERELAPLDLSEGSVRAVDRANAQVVTIPLARISTVTSAADH